MSFLTGATETGVYLGAVEEATADPLVDGLANEIGGDTRRLAIENRPEGRRHRNRTDPGAGLLRQVGEVKRESSGKT